MKLSPGEGVSSIVPTEVMASSMLIFDSWGTITSTLAVSMNSDPLLWCVLVGPDMIRKGECGLSRPPHDVKLN